MKYSVFPVKGQGVCTFLRRQKHPPTPAWRTFPVPVHSDWTPLPGVNKHLWLLLTEILEEKETTRALKRKASSYRKPEQRFGPDHNERFAEVSDHLSPEEVEVLGRSGGVDHRHVDGVAVHTLFFTVAHLTDKSKWAKPDFLPKDDRKWKSTDA